MNTNDLLSCREQIQLDLTSLLNSRFSLYPKRVRSNEWDLFTRSVSGKELEEIKDLACKIVENNFNNFFDK